MSQPWISPPARFLSGVSTQPRKSLFGGFPAPNPASANIYFSDFNSYVAGDWTVTTTNSGTTTLTAGNGGTIVLAGGGTATNFQGNTLNPASFAITPGYRAWFACSFTVSDIATAASPSFIIGLCKGTVATPTDGVYFTKASGANATVSAVLRASSTSSTITNVATLTGAAQVTLGWFYNGMPSPSVEFFSSSGVTSATAFGTQNITGGQVVAVASGDTNADAPLTNLPASTALMAPQVYMVQPTTATSPTITVDWIFAAAELNRP